MSVWFRLLVVNSLVLATAACTASKNDDDDDDETDDTGGYDLVEEEGEDGGGDGIEEEGPDIEIDPMELDFGDVYVDGVEAPPASVTEVMTIRNVGGGPLEIDEIYLADTNAPYEIGSLSTILIQPEGTATFSVTFHPETAGPTQTKVLIESNDPDESTVEVAILGQGIAPDIEISPTEYDFGTLYIGCDSEQLITISNVGTAPLIVSNLQMNTGSSDFAFDDALLSELPLEIAPEAFVEVAVSYAPFDDYADIAYLVVESNDPYTPQVTAVQEGLGELYGEGTDIFEADGGTSEFVLTNLPLEDTIEVRIDGLGTTVGWTYSAGDNAIVFDASHIPVFGSTVEVEYGLLGVCE